MQIGSGKARPRRRIDVWDLTATLVLGLLEMKAQEFFRESPETRSNYESRPFLRLGSNVDADSNVGAIVLTVGDVSRGAHFQLAVYSRVLVNGEGHGARSVWLRFLGN